MTSNRQRKFLWGAATSSYQTEGGITNNDWHYFTTTDSIRKRISISKTVVNIIGISYTNVVSFDAQTDVMDFKLGSK
ncbi:MAG: hypothetical protein ABJB85_08910 [Nitrososphaerota archaeon]